MDSFRSSFSRKSMVSGRFTDHLCLLSGGIDRHPNSTHYAYLHAPIFVSCDASKILKISYTLLGVFGP